MKGRLILNMTPDQRLCMEYLGKGWKVVGETSGMPVVTNGANYFALSPRNPDRQDNLSCMIPVHIVSGGVYEQTPAVRSKTDADK